MSENFMQIVSLVNKWTTKKGRLGNGEMKTQISLRLSIDW